MFEDNSIDDSLHVSMKKEYLSISYLNPESYPRTSLPRIIGTCTIDHVECFRIGVDKMPHLASYRKTCVA